MFYIKGYVLAMGRYQKAYINEIPINDLAKIVDYFKEKYNV
jgi:hypothetical protein